MDNQKKEETKEINKIQAKKDNPGMTDDELNEVTGGEFKIVHCRKCGRLLSECICFGEARL